MNKYYEENKDKAEEIIKQFVLDKWKDKEILEYWDKLGYDVFFVNSVVKPYIQKCRADNLNV